MHMMSFTIVWYTIIYIFQIILLAVQYGSVYK